MSTQNIKAPATQSRRWRWLGGLLGAVLAGLLGSLGALASGAWILRRRGRSGVGL